MAEMENEVAALRAKVAELEAENARLKATRAAFYKMYLETEGKTNSGAIFTRAKVFEALKLSADREEPAPQSANDGRPPKWKADWDDKAKQHLLHADGTPKTKAEYGGIAAVYRAVKEEVEAKGDEFVSIHTFRRHAEQILKVAQGAEDARLALAQANVET